MNPNDLNEVYELGVLVGKIEALDEVLESLRERLGRDQVFFDKDDKKFVESQFADASIAVLNIKAALLRVAGDRLY